MSLSDLMAVFIARRSDCSRRVEGAVARRIVEGAKSFIRRNVSWRHHNQGYDIVADALSHLLEAMATPEGACAKGLAICFETRMRFIIQDRIRSSRGWAERRNVFDDKLEEVTPASLPDPTDAIEREQTLTAVDDPRDRQMLRDHYDGFNWREIGQRHACDESTARRRVKGLVALAKPGTKIKGRA